MFVKIESHDLITTNISFSKQILQIVFFFLNVKLIIKTFFKNKKKNDPKPNKNKNLILFLQYIVLCVINRAKNTIINKK